MKNKNNNKDKEKNSEPIITTETATLILMLWVLVAFMSCGRTLDARPHDRGPGGPHPPRHEVFDRGPRHHHDRGPSRGRQNAELIIGTTLGVLDIATRAVTTPKTVVVQQPVYTQQPSVVYTTAPVVQQTKTIYYATSGGGVTYYSHPTNVPHVLVNQTFDRFKSWNDYGYVLLDGQWSKVSLPANIWR